MTRTETYLMFWMWVMIWSANTPDIGLFIKVISMVFVIWWGIKYVKEGV